MTKNIILGLLLFTLSAASLSAQKDGTEDVIKIDTSLVSVPVVVSDRQGRYVPGLTNEIAGTWTVRNNI